jgi:hypothetical protein
VPRFIRHGILRASPFVPVRVSSSPTVRDTSPPADATMSVAMHLLQHDVTGAFAAGRRPRASRLRPLDVKVRYDDDQGGCLNAPMSSFVRPLEQCLR